ncbi:MAG: c-type cytochrome [Gammaproteobacteria bacterium]|nr:c-type cytochrome [Gammaproteobacteria bacterium]
MEWGFTVGAVIVGVALVLIINSLVDGALRDGPADMSDEAVAARIAPVARLNTGGAVVAVEAPAAPERAGEAPAAAASAGRSGEKVYGASCSMCHATGASGAPRLGNSAEWAPRIAKGMDALMGSALNGLNAMPPRGLCATCSDEELRATIQYMVDNSN